MAFILGAIFVCFVFCIFGAQAGVGWGICIFSVKRNGKTHTHTHTHTHTRKWPFFQPFSCVFFLYFRGPKMVGSGGVGTPPMNVTDALHVLKVAWLQLGDLHEIVVVQSTHPSKTLHTQRLCKSPSLFQVLQTLYHWCGKRAHKNSQKKTPFFNAKFPGNSKKSTKVFWRAGKVNNN